MGDENVFLLGKTLMYQYQKSNRIMFSVFKLPEKTPEKELTYQALL